jgi:ATP-dependent Clp protease ATP-binding subunit ClpB
MTSNIGSRTIQEMAGRDLESVREAVLPELKTVFRPEFLNRVDEVVLFGNLSREDILGIVDIQLGILLRRLREKDISLQVDETARQFLAEEGWDPAFGARPLKRAIQRHLENPLSKRILAGEFPPGATVRAFAENEAIRFEVVPEMVN